MIRVSIRLAGLLRNAYKKSPSAEGEEVDLPPKARVVDLLDHYLIPHEKAHLIVVNRRRATLATILSHGDEVRILPLAGGG